MKNNTLKTNFLLFVFTIFSTKFSFYQMVFSENFIANSCSDSGNAFYNGCLPGWSSTSGSPNMN